jgi:D-alanyl-D-alanine carboxypeptidase (penicillin-binding protein 5/6)
MQLIAVVLAAPTTADRFDGATNLLDYGFANYAVVKPADDVNALGEVKVEKGERESVQVKVGEGFSALIPKSKLKLIQSENIYSPKVTAPVKKGDVVGEAVFMLEGAEIGRAKLVAAEDVKRISVGNIFSKLFNSWLAWE